MTDSIPSRGPDFLPYPLPVHTVATLASPAQPPPTTWWQRAVAGLTPWGAAAVTAGGLALLAVLGVSLLAGHRQAGAVLASLAGLVALVAGVTSQQHEQPDETLTLVRAGMGTGAVATLVALLMLLTHHSTIAEQPPVQIPSPAPTTSYSPLPQSQPPQPRSTPSLGVLPPGSSDLFGLPTEPDPPVTEAGTDKGLLTGRVVTTSGAALPGALVTVTRADPTDLSDDPPCPVKQTTTTDARGQYHLELCQLGNNLGYHVTVTAGTAGASTNLYVNSGRTTVYNVILAVRRA